MSDFLIIIGLILYFSAFIILIITFGLIIPKAEKNTLWVILPILTTLGFIIVGMMSFSMGMKIKEEQPMQLSQSCGTVIDYIYYENCTGRSRKTCNPFERIEIRLDNSNNSRLMRFDRNLSRQTSNKHVCFAFYDRHKYSYLQDSRITQWIE
ncbi:hypothetical protein OZX61_12915 (plasmid) [Acinetobacter sp. ESL0695]|uniref:hypothetical protein n=1 Tax=Acinetobacter sp. ESL0695 TaxID=2983215 RepID=UPI0023F14412|nr:hypothetical protein [Acinetobacter sp. ESL0695]WEV50261.1 hypothetical protein OZX61_12915 [Acinetobacter sp. ESL0695]